MEEFPGIQRSVVQLCGARFDLLHFSLVSDMSFSGTAQGRIQGGGGGGGGATGGCSPPPPFPPRPRYVHGESSSDSRAVTRGGSLGADEPPSSQERTFPEGHRLRVAVAVLPSTIRLLDYTYSTVATLGFVSHCTCSLAWVRGYM